MKKEKNEFEVLKARLLRSKLVALLIFIVLILTNFSTLKNLFDSLYPYKKLSIQCYPNTIISGEFESQEITLNISFQSEKSFLINDAKIFIETHSLKDYEKNEENIILETQDLRVPFLSNSNSTVKMNLKFRTMYQGNYTLKFTVKSKESGLTATDSCPLRVYPFKLENIRSLNVENNRLLIERLGIVDFAPDYALDFGMFRVFFPDEAEKTNYLKATLWFTSSYLGSAGGTGYSIYRNITSVDELYANNDTMPDIFLTELEKDFKNLKNMEEIGYVSIDYSIVPIGTRFYQLDILDNQRIQVKPVTIIEDTLLLVPINEFDKKQYYVLKNPKLNFSTFSSYGATGRNYYLELEIDNKTYQYIEHFEPSFYNIESDFPIFLKLNEGYPNYLKISYENDNLVFIKCKLH